MAANKDKSSRWLTAVIIFVSIVGVVYFGLEAISDNTRKNRENPFEYDIEYFKNDGSEQVSYAQVRKIDVTLNEIYGLAVGPMDKVYVSGDDVFVIYNQDGSVDNQVVCGAAVLCLAVDRNQDVYLGMEEHVEVFDSTGVKKAEWQKPGDDALITSITLSRDYVFLADAGNHIVWKYDKSGRLLGGIGERNEEKEIPGFVIPSPFFDVAVDPEDFLWVVNPGRHSLENYTREGGLRTSWGEPSMNIDGFCGCCNPTHIAIMKDGSFVTGEKGIARVKIYNRLGELAAVVAASDQFEEGTVGLDLAVDSSDLVYVLDPKQKAVRIFDKKTKSGEPGV